MKLIARLAAALALVLSSGAAFAAEQTATLEVKNVSCASCGPIVKKALARVPGVSQVTVNEGSSDIATAIVKFDDAKTNVAALVEATTKAGYPSRAVQ